MPSYWKNDVILVRYPFSDLSGSKVRPAIVINEVHPSQDLIILPLTSRIAPLQTGEFALAEWSAAGLNVPSAVKRGVYMIHRNLILKTIGTLSSVDAKSLELALRVWLGLP